VWRLFWDVDAEIGFVYIFGKEGEAVDFGQLGLRDSYV